MAADGTTLSTADNTDPFIPKYTDGTPIQWDGNYAHVLYLLRRTVCTVTCSTVYWSVPIPSVAWDSLYLAVLSTLSNLGKAVPLPKV